MKSGCPVWLRLLFFHCEYGGTNRTHELRVKVRLDTKLIWNNIKIH
jgi:hypothetical protein